LAVSGFPAAPAADAREKTALFCVALMSAVYGGLVAMCLATSQNAN